MYQTVIVFAGIVIACFSRTFLSIAGRVLSPIRSSYASAHAINSSSMDISYTTLALALVGMVILWFLRGYNGTGIKNRRFLFYILFVLFLSVPVGAGLGYANRIFKFFEVYLIFILPLGQRLIKKNTLSQLCFNLLFYASTTFWWMLTYVYLGFDGIVPYYPFWKG